MPPSYGVPGGPLKEPFRCVRSSPLPAGSAFILDRLSEWMSATSFAMRRVRLDDMAGFNVKMRLLKESLGLRYGEER